MEISTWSNEICVFTPHIRLICSDCRSKITCTKSTFCEAKRLHICKMELFVENCCPVILNKWPLSLHLGICFGISEPVLVQTIAFRVWVLDLQLISAMYAFGSWVGPSDEIRSYPNWTYTEYGTKSRIEPTEATGIYSFVFISYMCWIWARNFRRYKCWSTFNGILSKSSIYRR